MSSHDQFPPRTPATAPQLRAGLSAALSAQRACAEQGRRPFAAALVGPDGATVLLRQLSVSHWQHAEAELCRAAAAQFAPAYLWRCTLYSTWEPCAMCAATLYWANVGALVFAAGERALARVTGAGNADNFTMDLPCRRVFAAGQKDVRVVGPLTGPRGKATGAVAEGYGDGDGGGDGLDGLEIDEDWETMVCEAAWVDYWAERRGLGHMSWKDMTDSPPADDVPQAS